MGPFRFERDNPQNGERRQAGNAPQWGARESALAGNIVPAMGNNLKKLRNEAGKTQAQVAAAMGLSKSGYVKIEDGDRRLTDNYIRRAAKALGVKEVEIIQEEADDQGDAVPLSLDWPVAAESPNKQIKLARPDFAGLCRRLIRRLDVMGVSGTKAAGDVGISSEQARAFRNTAMNIETADIPDLDRDRMDALATRLGTNLEWLVYGEGDENFCKEPLELQEAIRKLRDTGPETWRHISAVLDALKARKA